MFSHNSVLHVNQCEGLYYSKDNLAGYYNNLIDKVKFTNTFNDKGIPINFISNGNEKKEIYFPIAIFQYGLGAYDMYIETNNIEFFEKAKMMADWAIENQLPEGYWDTFGSHFYDCVYSSMAQGEAASLLARVFYKTKNEKYKIACIKAIDFMLRDKKNGGTADYSHGLMLYEYPDKALVLNGWIFSSFGLYDCWKITGDEKYKRYFELSMQTIAENLNRFNSIIWSYYDLDGKYTSPFYMNLHVELLKACNTLYPNLKFEKYLLLWTKRSKNWFIRKLAIIKKGFQKICEKKSNTWFLVE